ncbi:VUT family protein [Ensifer sp. LCM 4579]|uniref:VUT family protein n=1 Tax=Ensifer sp. LCM 4579 TaxID=1848292 RepID=UPI000B1ECFE1|nr:VUT family protein [Ensifer sp. LCM 4579]
MIGILALAGFAATIPAANWMIGNLGTVCVPDGPCLIPVGFGLSAPSGVLIVGLALVLRDVVHEHFGARGALLAILAGCLLSAFFAPPALALASVAAFALAELADLAVYEPLRRRRLLAAVLLSGVAGAVVDSAAFLWLAFGSLDFIAGNTVGKIWASLAAVPFISVLRVSTKATP